MAALGLPRGAPEDDPPAFTGDPTWAIARDSSGYSKTSGNTDTSAGNFLVPRGAHVVGDWKFLFGAEGLYGSTHGETTAQAWDVHGQANYNLTPTLYWYGGARYDDDRFSGFAYQAALTSGVGYQFINTDDTKLTVQVGVGVPRLQQGVPGQGRRSAASSSASITTQARVPYQRARVAFDGAVNFEHSFNDVHQAARRGDACCPAATTRSPPRSIALQVKMIEPLALAAG